VIAAVFFDLGGTLIDAGGPAGMLRLNGAGIKNVYDFLELKKYPLPPLRRFQKKITRSLKMAHLMLMLSSREIDAKKLAGKIFSKMKINPSDEDFEEIERLWHKPFLESAALLPDVRDVLARVKERKIKMGVISNTIWPARLLADELQRLAILDYFEVLVLSSETSIRKPSPFIFEAACKKIAIPSSDCLMVGDAVKEDIYGALSAGMKAVLLAGRFKRPPGAAPCYEIENLVQLIDVIDELNGPAPPE